VRVIRVQRQPLAETGARHEGVASHPWVAIGRPLGDGACRHPGPRKENDHGDQAWLPPGKAQMEDQRTGGRADLLL
jgi:hypothetical protein